MVDLENKVTELKTQIEEVYRKNFSFSSLIDWKITS